MEKDVHGRPMIYEGHENWCSCIRYRGYPCNCPGKGPTTSVIGNTPQQIPSTKGHGVSSTVHICELCGAMATGNAIGVVQLRTTNDFNKAETVNKEICPGCVGAIMSFLETDREPTDKAYRIAWERPKSDEQMGTERLVELLRDTLSAAEQKQVEGGRG